MAEDNDGFNLNCDILVLTIQKMMADVFVFGINLIFLTSQPYIYEKLQLSRWR